MVSKGSATGRAPQSFRRLSGDGTQKEIRKNLANLCGLVFALGVEPKETVEIHSQQSLDGDLLSVDFPECTTRDTGRHCIDPDLLILRVKPGYICIMLAGKCLKLPKTNSHFRQMLTNRFHQIKAQAANPDFRIGMLCDGFSRRLHQVFDVTRRDVIEQVFLALDVMIKSATSQSCCLSNLRDAYARKPLLGEQAGCDASNTI